MGSHLSREWGHILIIVFNLAREWGHILIWLSSQIKCNNQDVTPFTLNAIIKM